MSSSPLVILTIVLAVLAAVGGAVIYSSNLAQDNSTCHDPDSISSHVYIPGRLQTIRAVHNSIRRCDGQAGRS